MGHFQLIGRALSRSGRVAFFCPLAFLACQSPDPKEALKVTDVETYWVLDPSRTDKRYLAPAVRFRVENASKDKLIAVDATAAFKRDGSDESWGSGFFRLTEAKSMDAGAKVIVTMSSDARYTFEGDPSTAFTNPSFKAVNVTFFLKVGSSPWVEFGKAPIENVIGSKDARAVLAQPQTLP